MVGRTLPGRFASFSVPAASVHGWTLSTDDAHSLCCSEHCGQKKLDNVEDDSFKTRGNIK